MKESSEQADAAAHGLAALTILKMLLDVMEKKKLLSEEELKIILNCAGVDVLNAGKGLPKREAKDLIENLFSGEDPVTTLM